MEVISYDLELWTMWLNSGVWNTELEGKLRVLRDEIVERLEQIKKRKSKQNAKWKKTCERPIYRFLITSVPINSDGIKYS